MKHMLNAVIIIIFDDCRPLSTILPPIRCVCPSVPFGSISPEGKTSNSVEIFSVALIVAAPFSEKDKSYSGTLLLINANSLGSSRQSGCPTRRAVYNDGYLRRRSSLLIHAS